MPIRIQRKRTKGWKMPPNTIYVGRPTKWGNPYIVGTLQKEIGLPITQKDAVDLYKCLFVENAIIGYRSVLITDFSELRGRNLACWCPLDKPCHADVLLEIANR